MTLVTTPHGVVIDFEPVPTGFYFTVGHVSDIPLRYVVEVPGDIGSPFPTPLTQPAALTNIEGQPYPYLTEDDPLFPAGHYNSTNGVWRYSRSIKLISTETLTSIGDSRDPFFVEGSRTAFEGQMALESEVCDALYNVKTWKIEGSYGEMSFDFQVRSGQRKFISSDGEEVIIPEEPPFSGRRGAMRTFVSYDATTRSDEGDSPYQSIFVSLDIGGFSLSSEGPDLASVTPYAQIPNIALYITYYDSGAYNEEEDTFPDAEFFRAESLPSSVWFTSTREEVSGTFMFLGREARLFHTLDSPADGVNVTVSAAEWWTKDDPWVEAWA